MVSQRIQILGISLSVIGWLMTVVVCALPMWRVTYIIGSIIITDLTVWEGLWKACVTMQSTGQMQCRVYDSMPALPRDLQARRAMIVISILTGIFGVITSITGAKYTNCIKNERSKARTCILSGVLVIVSGFLCLIPVSWTTYNIVSDFDNPLLHAMPKAVVGASLYIGWAAAALLFVGGELLCWNCPPKEETCHSAHKYTASTTGEHVI